MGNAIDVIGIQSGNHFVNANPQAYLDEVAKVDNFFKLRERLNETLMKIIMTRFDFEEKHRELIKINVKDQQFWKGIQAFTKLGSGLATGAVAILAAFVNETVANALKGISQAVPLVGDTAYIYLDGVALPLSTELQEYLNTASLDKQKQQQLRDLSKELQQNVMEIMRLQLQMYRTSALQGG